MAAVSLIISINTFNFRKYVNSVDVAILITYYIMDNNLYILLKFVIDEIETFVRTLILHY